MYKIICDICDEKEADNNYKIKKKCYFGFYEEIDICDECFEKMKTVKDYKKLFNRVSDQVIKGSDSLYNGDIDKQSAYLDGVEAVCNVIDPKYQFKI